MKLYLSGPMTGKLNHNFDEFNRVAKSLRQRRHEVVNPAELGMTPGWEWDDYMKRDLLYLVRCEAIAVLDGWEKSRGARLEVSVAAALGLPIYEAETMSRVEISWSPQLIEGDSVCREALKLVHGDRQDSYGHPYEDFSRTAKIWTEILGHAVTPAQVALCMIGVKLSREVNKPKRDNVVDIAGYAETLQMVKDYEVENA